MTLDIPCYPEEDIKNTMGTAPAVGLKITFDRHILSLSLDVGTVTHGYYILQGKTISLVVYYL